MKHVENIVVGTPEFSPAEMFASNEEDWINSEMEKTEYTTERFLPKILVDFGFTKSISEIRRNRPDLVKTLDKFEFLEIKLGKRKIWILVGEKI